MLSTLSSWLHPLIPLPRHTVRVMHYYSTTFSSRITISLIILRRISIDLAGKNVLRRWKSARALKQQKRNFESTIVLPIIHLETCMRSPPYYILNAGTPHSPVLNGEVHQQVMINPEFKRPHGSASIRPSYTGIRLDITSYKLRRQKSTR